MPLPSTELQEVSSKVYPGLDRSPKENWVDKAGGLPSYIERVAKHLVYERGYQMGRAIATAVNWNKKGCATGTTFGGKVKVSKATQAAMCKAVAEWEAKKAKSKAKSIAEAIDLLEAGGEDVELSTEDAQELLRVMEARLQRVELVRGSLLSPGATSGGVKAAKALLEATDADAVSIQIGGPFADPREAETMRREMGHERAQLRALVEGFGGELSEAKADDTEDAEKRVEKIKGRGPRDRPTGRHSGDTLKKGVSGKLVQHAQTRLKDLGYDVTVDGDFGEETDAALKSFQGDHKLKVDGVLGRETKTAMRGTTEEDVRARRSEVSPKGDATSEPTSTPEDAPRKKASPEAASGPEASPNTPYDWLTKGRGVGDEPDEKVEAAQRSLQDIGTFIGDAGADGRFGPETEKGVKRVQRRFGLKPDGLIGPQTGAVLARHGKKTKDVEEALIGGFPTSGGGDGSGGLKTWNPKLHPRNRVGRFREILSKLTPTTSFDSLAGVGHNSVLLPGGTLVERLRRDRFRIKSGGKEIGSFKGAADAAKAALDHHGLQESAGDLEEAGFRYDVFHAPQTTKARQAGEAQMKGRDGKPVRNRAANAQFEREHPRVHVGRTGGGQFIRKGDSGAEVKKVQRAVGVKQDGDFGTKTKEAVERFQRQYGLQVDGIVGAQTARAMRGGKGAKVSPGPLGGGSGSGGTSASTKTSSSKTSKKSSSSSGSSTSGSSESSGSSSGSSSSTGSSSATTTFAAGQNGNQVKKIQRLLGLDPSGNFDKATTAQVKEYQRKHGLTVDGIVGAQTLASLLGKPAEEPGVITDDLLTALGSYSPEKSKPKPNPSPKPKPNPQAGVTSGKLVESAVTAEKIAAEAVTHRHIATSAAGAGPDTKVDLPQVEGLLTEAAYVQAILDQKPDTSPLHLLQEAEGLGRLGGAIRSGAEFLTRSGTSVRRLPGGKWQARDRSGRWKDMPNIPDLKGLTPASQARTLQGGSKAASSDTDAASRARAERGLKQETDQKINRLQREARRGKIPEPDDLGEIDLRTLEGREQARVRKAIEKIRRENFSRIQGMASPSASQNSKDDDSDTAAVIRNLDAILPGAKSPEYPGVRRDRDGHFVVRDPDTMMQTTHAAARGAARKMQQLNTRWAAKYDGPAWPGVGGGDLSGSGAEQSKVPSTKRLHESGGPLAELAIGESHERENGTRVVRTASGYLVSTPGDQPMLCSGERALQEAETFIEESAAPPPAIADVAADLLGDEWTADLVTAALDQLEEQGINLDQQVDQAATLAAVIKAANINPGNG